jgi:hypothetical protein
MSPDDTSSDNDQPTNDTNQFQDDPTNGNENYQPSNTNIQNIKHGVRPLPTGRLDAAIMYDLITKKEDVLNSVPLGYQNNCFMLIDNGANLM